jgi:peptide/nickel transport system substrate-binding protein
VGTSAPIRPPWVYIAPEHLWGNTSCDQIKKEPFFEDGKPMVGTGPFQLTEWNKGEDWTMTANPNYWGGAPHISQFKVVLYDNSEAMVNALKQGEIDYTNLGSVDLFNQLQSESQSGSSNITTHVGPAVTFGQMSFNMCDPTSPDAAPYCQKNPGTGNPALRDPAVRTAISWAIDRQTIVDKVLAGYGEPGTTIVPPFATFYHYTPTPDETIGFSIDKANQILDDAGYKDTDGNDIRNDPKTGQDLNFRFILRSESDIGARLGTYVSGWLKQIGIATTSEVVSDGKLSQAWLANDFDMYIWGWGPDPDPDFILSTFTSGQCGTWSDTCYANPAYDKLYKEQQTAPTPQDRQKIVFQMQDTIYKDIPEIVLYYDKSLEAYNSAKWTGLEDNISPQPEGFLWNQYTPYTALTLQLRGTESSSSGGATSGLLVIVGILGAIIVVVGIVMIARRGRSDEDLA